MLLGFVGFVEFCFSGGLVCDVDGGVSVCEVGKRFWERGIVDCMVMEYVEFVEACFCNCGYQSAVGGVK